MRRLAIVVSVFIVLSGVLGYARGNTATAQAATPAALAAHPVVGMWRTVVSNTGAPPSTSLTTFHADGTYLEVVQDGPIVTGLWQPSGERTATVTAYVFFAIDDRPVEGEVRLTIEVDETGNALTEEGTVVGFYQDGSVALAVESPATGTRLEVLPVEPLGTPVLPPEDAAAGTPTS
jgi:hypothetical protein